jgi:hypothetical protein
MLNRMQSFAETVFQLANAYGCHDFSVAAKVATTGRGGGHNLLSIIAVIESI